MATHKKPTGARALAYIDSTARGCMYKGLPFGNSMNLVPAWAMNKVRAAATMAYNNAVDLPSAFNEMAAACDIEVEKYLASAGLTERQMVRNPSSGAKQRARGTRKERQPLYADWYNSPEKWLKDAAEHRMTLADERKDRAVGYKPWSKETTSGIKSMHAQAIEGAKITNREGLYGPAAKRPRLPNPADPWIRFTDARTGYLQWEGPFSKWKVGNERDVVAAVRKMKVGEVEVFGQSDQIEKFAPRKANPAKITEAVINDANEKLRKLERDERLENVTGGVVLCLYRYRQSQWEAANTKGGYFYGGSPQALANVGATVFRTPKQIEKMLEKIANPWERWL